jgi:hypothetical protein
MIGEKLTTADNTYTITRRVTTDNSPNANIYLCEDVARKKYIVKHVYNQAPMSNVALGMYNH